MQGLKKWSVFLGVLVLLVMALLAGPGFTFPERDGQSPAEENGGSEDGSPSWTPQDIMQYIEDWLRGDDPVTDGGNEGEVPSEGEGEVPGGGDVPPPSEEALPPAAPAPPAQDNGPVTQPGGNQKEEATDTLDPAPTITEGLEQNGEEMGSISGIKFLDANLNGCRDVGEPGIEGVGIRLEKGCDTWCAITDKDGSYCFTGLVADAYEVEVIEDTVPAGHFHTTDPDELMCLKPGCMDQVVDFGNGVRGEEETGSISGCKFLDANLNGCRDEGEPGIAGVGVRLEKGYDTWEQVTGPDGSYSFQGLKAGAYVIEVIEDTVPAGHFHTTDPDELMCLKPGYMNAVVDFGNGVRKEEDLGSISGRKWRDGDANGEFSFSDCPMSGVEIQLWQDGRLVATQTTSNAPGEKGSYCFGALEPGTYTVREAAPAGYYPTNPTSGEWVIDLQPGEKRCSVNFLNASSLSISGTKWEWRDENGDGIIQDGERYPLEGVTIQVCSPCSPEPVQAVTAADGAYTFKDLKPGIYTVKEVLIPGWHAVDPASGCRLVELLCDYDQSDVDFVNASDPSISGIKWEWVDGNANGEVDEGEYSPLPGIEIRLLQNGVEVLPSVFTDKNGGYSFNGLKPGIYTVSEVLTQGWNAMYPQGGTQQVEVKAGIDASNTDFLNSQVEVAGEVVTPVTPVAGAQATGELPQTGMNQLPLILASGILVLIGLLFLALGIIRSFSS